MAASRTQPRVGKKRKGKKIEKSVEKGGIAGPKVHRKPAGFSAFSKQKKTGRSNQWVAVEEAVEPETGIHSKQWAETIVKQKDATILQLPFELRKKIWLLAFDDFSFGDKTINPRKKGVKFSSSNWPGAAHEALMLPLTCRQMYVDVVGSGLLYSHKTFSFTKTLMANYLWVINPLHKEAIRSIQLEHRIVLNVTLPHKAFDMLATFKNLKHLTIRFDVCLEYTAQYRAWDWAERRKYFNNFRIPRRVLQQVSDSEQLKSIKNLASFSLRFGTSRHYSGIIGGYHQMFEYIDEPLANVPVGQNLRGPYGELEEHIKLHVLDPKFLPRVRTIDAITANEEQAQGAAVDDAGNAMDGVVDLTNNE